jgi:hypothetical protein
MTPSRVAETRTLLITCFADQPVVAYVAGVNSTPPIATSVKDSTKKQG